MFCYTIPMSEVEQYIPAGVEVVGFDWDGCVVDSVKQKLLQNQAIAKEFGNMLTPEEVRKLWNESSGFADLMGELTNDASMVDIYPIIERDYNKPEYAKRNFNFSRQKIKALRGMGLRTVLITNLNSKMLSRDASDLNFNLYEYFDLVQTADDYECKKPDGRVFNPTLERFGIAASKLLYIGDELKDYEAAQAADANFIGVCTGMSTASEFNNVGAIHVPSIKEIQAYANI